MKVSELGIWGFTSEELKKYNKKRICLSCLIYGLDIVLMVLVITIMYLEGSSFNYYLGFLVVLTLGSSLLLSTFLNDSKIQAYHTLKHTKNHAVIETDIHLTLSELHCLMNKVSRLRLKTIGTLDEYVSLLNKTCSVNKKYSKKIFKLLSEFDTQEEDTLVLKCFSVEYKKNNILILVKEGTEY